MNNKGFGDNSLIIPVLVVLIVAALVIPKLSTGYKGEGLRVYRYWTFRQQAHFDSTGRFVPLSDLKGREFPEYAEHQRVRFLPEEDSVLLIYLPDEKGSQCEVVIRPRQPEDWLVHVPTPVCRDTAGVQSLEGAR